MSGWAGTEEEEKSSVISRCTGIEDGQRFCRLPGFPGRLEQPAVQATIPKYGIEALVVSVLPGTGGRSLFAYPHCHRTTSWGSLAPTGRSCRASGSRGSRGETRRGGGRTAVQRHQRACRSGHSSARPTAPREAVSLRRPTAAGQRAARRAPRWNTRTAPQDPMA